MATSNIIKVIYRYPQILFACKIHIGEKKSRVAVKMTNYPEENKKTTQRRTKAVQMKNDKKIITDLTFLPFSLSLS